MQHGILKSKRVKYHKLSKRLPPLTVFGYAVYRRSIMMGCLQAYHATYRMTELMKNFKKPSTLLSLQTGGVTILDSHPNTPLDSAVRVYKVQRPVSTNGGGEWLVYSENKAHLAFIIPDQEAKKHMGHDLKMYVEGSFHQESGFTTLTIERRVEAPSW